MHRTILAALLLTACSSSTPSPSEYHDGPMARPVPERVAPGYSPIGAGLPEYMPMPQQPAYPRSPHKRVLPPTAEPTLYGGDAPRAAQPQLDTNLGRINLPIPKHTGLGAQPFEEVEPVMDCAKGLEAALAAADPNGMWWHYYEVLPHMPPNNRMACVAARLYKHCADEKHKAASDPKKRKILEEIQKVAAAFLFASCEGKDLTDHEKDIIKAAVGVWRP